MAPSLRPLPPPSSRRRPINPDRASRRKVNSYREADSDTDDEFINAFLNDYSDADYLPAGQDDSSATATSLYAHTSSSPRKRNKRPEAIINREYSNPPSLHPATTTALPYHILHDIFLYAWEMSSHRPTHHAHDVKWMLGVARLCRSFFDAAIGVIWNSPPLYPITKLNRLQAILSQPAHELFTNYANRIHDLEVHWPHYTAQKWQLVELVSRMPRLQNLRFLEYAQDAPGRTSYFSDWEGLFDALDRNEVRLRSWDWNLSVMRVPRDISLDALSVYHTRPCFTSLRTLRFVNFNDEVLSLLLMREPAPQPHHHHHHHHQQQHQIHHVLPATDELASMPIVGQSLAEAVKMLPTLQHLEFSHCSILDEGALLNLPNNSLRSLTLDSCKYLTSRTFTLFLASHGTQLKELTVKHNPSLTMSFITNLATLCPNLEVLKFGFNADGPIINTSTITIPDEEGQGSNGIYKTIITLSDEGYDPPTWPKTLQHLEIDRPGRWSERTAVDVFNSLLDCAHELKDLRVLIINAILTIEWRSRASFRKKWEAKFEKAFRRCSEPPNPTWCTLGYKSGGGADGKSDDARTLSPAGSEPIPLSKSRPRRQITRVTSYRDGDTDDEDGDGDDGGRYEDDDNDDDDAEFKSTSGRTTATATASTNSTRTTRSSTDPTNNGSGRNSNSNNNEDDLEVPHVQGMCDVVRIRMDNMRPTDILRTADEFVDTESSGDEEWNGQDEVFEDGYAW
ncbi:hypothetical protein KEM54_001984 [Ascosphaera aggregata]|nr:hypothetical protein KEM54_001984 [Ascosphaera aggregata]